MLVHYFVEIDRPFEEAAALLPKLLGGLSEAADISYREGEELRAQVGISHPGIHKTVRLEVGELLSRADQTTIPLRWEAVGATELFPAMDADLTLAKVGPRITQLSFSGSYDPPLRTLGLVLDRMLHRIAEATVKRFTDRWQPLSWPGQPRRRTAPIRRASRITRASFRPAAGYDRSRNGRRPGAPTWATTVVPSPSATAASSSGSQQTGSSSCRRSERSTYAFPQCALEGSGIVHHL